MDIKLQFIVLVLTVIMACGSKCSDQPISEISAEAQVETPEIIIQIDGIKSGMVRLIGFYQGEQYLADTSRIIPDGKIIFKRVEPYKQGWYAIYLPDKRTIQILLGVDQSFSMKTNSGNLIKDMVVSGNIEVQLMLDDFRHQKIEDKKSKSLSSQMKKYTKGSEKYGAIKKQYDEALKERKDRLSKIFLKYPQSLFTTFKKAGQNPELQDIRKPDGSIDNQKQIRMYRREYWDNVDFSDERLLYTPVISNKLKKYISDLTIQRPDSIISSSKHLLDKVVEHPKYLEYFANFIALKYEPGKTPLMDAEAVFVHLIQNYFTYEYATRWTDSTQVYALQLRAHEMANSLMGLQAPDIKAKDPDGKRRSIYEIDKPYIIVYLYNPSCDHCEEQTPKLVKYANQNKSDIGVFAIAIDTTPEEWRSFIERYKTSEFINVNDPSNRAIYAKYYVNKTPEIYVLNPDKKIIAKNLKVFQIDQMIQKDREKL